MRILRAACALNCVGTVEDLAREEVELRDGLLLTLYADDLNDQGQLDELLVEGVVSFSEEEHGWVASIDWSAIRHASDGPVPKANGASHSSSASSGETGHGSRGS